MDPENTDDSPDETEDDTDDDTIMPPKQRKPVPNTFKTPLDMPTGAVKKKKSAPADAPFLPFSPLQTASFRQVTYSRDGGSWLEVSAFTSGFVNADEFTFELSRDGMTLAFSQVLPETFLRKSPPDFESMKKNERRALKNDSRTVHYATVVDRLRSALDYETSPHFAEAQIVVLEGQCESIAEYRGYASPTKHSVNGAQQYMTTFLCKLKVAAQQHKKKNRGSGIIVAGGGPPLADSSEEDDDDGSSGEESEAPAKGRGGGGGGGGGKKKSGGSGGGDRKLPAKKRGGMESSRSSKRVRDAAGVKHEPSLKSETGACGGGVISLMSQASDD